MSVKFVPSAAGTVNGTLTLYDNAANSPQRLTLTGTGVTATATGPVASLSPTSLNFGSVTVGSASSIQSVTITNTGNSALSFTAGAVLSSGFQFGGTGTCSTGVSYAPGSSCTMTVKFVPSAAGTVNGTMTIYDNAANSPQTVPLTGTGTTGTASTPTVTVAISPTSVSVRPAMTQQFTATVSGTTNTAVTWSVNGVQGGNSTVGSISTSGLYTAPSVVPSGGSVKVTATSAAVTSQSSSASVIISNPSGHDWYVSPSGSDSSYCGGSPGSPCATINYVNGMVSPGDTVHVTGSFSLNSSSCISTTRSGTADAPITYIADPVGSAKINGNGACFYIWHNTGNYVKIFGFNITGVQTGSNQDVILSEGGGGNVEIAHNTIHDLPAGFGTAIDMEPYSGGYTGAPCSVHDNTLFNIANNTSVGTYNNYAVYIACGTNTKVYNNLIYNEGSIAIHCWHAANNVHIYNNTINNAQIGILVGTGDSGGLSNAYFDVSNNIIANSKYGIMAENSSPATLSTSSVFRNNLIYNDGTNWYYNNNGTSTTIQGAGMTVTGTVTGNPIFVSPSSGDYHLSSGSPAIGAGINVGLTSNLDGNSIPSASGYNIGAY